MKNFFKSLVPPLCCAVILALSTHAAEPLPKLLVGIPKAPPALPLLRMIDSEALRDKAEIAIDVWSAPEQLIAMVQDGKHQMFVLPLTVAAKLRNKGIEVKLTNINTWNVGYLTSTDPTVKTWTDLKGKKLFVPLKSSTPDALTQYFLAHAGMKPETDVELIYSSMPEIGQLLKADAIENAIEHEPHLTAALAGNPRLRVVLGFEDEWKKLEGDAATIPNAGFGATETFLAQHAELVRAFEKEYEKATIWTVENPEQAGALAEKYLGLKAETIAQAMPRLGLRYRTAAAAEPDAEQFYRMLFAFSPETIGKKIPDATLYWK